MLLKIFSTMRYLKRTDANFSPCKPRQL